MAIRFDTTEVRHLAHDLSQAPGHVQRKAQRAIDKTAYDVEGDAKVLCPVDTGNLMNSISTETGFLEAEIGPTAHYGHYVEEGTSKMAPQPYMGPAFDRRTPGLSQALAQAAEDIL